MHAHSIYRATAGRQSAAHEYRNIKLHLPRHREYAASNVAPPHRKMIRLVVHARTYTTRLMPQHFAVSATVSTVLRMP